MFKHRKKLSLVMCVATLLAGGSVATLTFAKPPNKDDGANVNYAFVHIIFDKAGLYLTTIDGTDTFQLTKPGGRNWDNSPSWSHDLEPLTEGDQSKIAYLRHLFNDDRTYLYVINPDGSGNRLVRVFERNEPQPDDDNGEEILVWSPNGKEILFTDNDVSDLKKDTDGGIYALDVATGNVRTIMGREFVDGLWLSPRRFSISPLGLLAFEYLKDIYTVEFVIDENGLIQVDPQAEWTTITVSDPIEEWNEWPVWSPDGRYLAFTSTDRLADPDVTQLIVYDLLLDEFITVSEIQSGYRQVTWSPDGFEIGIAEVTNNRKSTLDIYSITDWDDADLRQFIRVTQDDRAHEFQPHWNPGHIQP